MHDGLRQKQQNLSAQYVSCTKEDTMMNVWLVRAKPGPYSNLCPCIQFPCHSCFPNYIVTNTCYEVAVLQEMEATGNGRAETGEEAKAGRVEKAHEGGEGEA